eukprot:SAG11_NODE_15438_length_578_cov_1.177453_2_plen_88_part_01
MATNTFNTLGGVAVLGGAAVIGGALWSANSCATPLLEKDRHGLISSKDERTNTDGAAVQGECATAHEDPEIQTLRAELEEPALAALRT